MELEIPGSLEDPIKKCPDCEYCIFEDFLSEKQRQKKVLYTPLPIAHIHRRTIEEICGKDHDEACAMKYAAMRAFSEDFMPSQFGALKNFKWDLGKEKKRYVGFEEAMREWTNEKNLEYGRKESYATRFREVWKKGLRKNKQILTTDMIYEIVVTKENELYGTAIKLLGGLFEEHVKRDNCTIDQNKAG
ncbi:MAG: hypothetical protein ACP5OG_01950 [Candidatus Nanoarchaeia archaeon]